jgi:hypothetical protein
MFVCCPHCDITIEIIELNCRIFRCGILKSNGQQIDPHLSKKYCDWLVERNEIYGCGKPFKVDPQPDGTLVCYECGYI